MTQARIVVDTGTLRPGGVGPATGTVWLALGNAAFPITDWNDFIVVILEAWVSALLRLLAGVSSHEIVHFMDGPYAVEVVSISASAFRLRAIEGGRHERICIDTNALPLIESLLAGSEEVLNVARDRDCWSAEAEKLNVALPALRREAIRLKN